MRKNDDYRNMMTAEDRARAKKDDQGLWRFILALLMTVPYGAIAFFDVWKMRDAVPYLLIQLFPGVRDGNPTRIYTYISILVGGLMWFVTFAILWHLLARPDVSWKKRLMTLGIWCAAAALLYVLLVFSMTVIL